MLGAKYGFGAMDHPFIFCVNIRSSFAVASRLSKCLNIYIYLCQLSSHHYVHAFFWDVFLHHFDADLPCSYHLVGLCVKCSHWPPPQFFKFSFSVCIV